MKVNIDKKLIIHHISDIHFGTGLADISGGVTKYSTDDPSNNLTDKYLEYLQTATDRKPNVLIVSGDLTTLAETAEFVSAQKFLRKLNSIIAPQQEQRASIIVVPGNHDVDWKMIKPRESALQTSELALSVFFNFMREFTLPFDKSFANNKPYLFLKDYGVLIYGLTSVRLGGSFDEETIKAINNFHDTWKATTIDNHNKLMELDTLLSSLRVDPAYIYTDELQRISEDLTDMNHNLGSDPSIKIAVLHHNLTSTAAAEARKFDLPINAGEIKHYLLKNGFQIVLHGHKHEFHAVEETNLTNRKSVHIIGAGTLSSYGTDQGFNEIEVNGEEKFVTITQFKWRPNEFEKDSARMISIDLGSEKRHYKGELRETVHEEFLEGLLRTLKEFEHQSHSIPDTARLDVVHFLEGHFYGVSGVDREFIDTLRIEMESRESNALFFTDIVGPRGWGHHNFALHMAYQIRHYIDMNKDCKNQNEWELWFSPLLQTAIHTCFDNASQHSISSEEFGWLRDTIDDDLHTAMDIPLFYLSPARFVSRYLLSTLPHIS